MRYLVLSLFLVSLNLNAQTIVGEVKFDGLKKTKVSYLNRYLKLSKGAPFDSATLRSDVQSLENLQLFSEINYALSYDSNSVFIVYTVKEKLTLLPLINFGGIRDNFFLQLGFTNYNWLGKGGRLSSHYMYYDRHSFSLSMWLPYLFSSDYGVSINANKYSTLEPLFFEAGTVTYEYDNKAIEVLGVKEFKLNHTLSAGGTFFQETYRKYAPLDYAGSPGPGFRIANKYLAKVVHYLKNVDYYYHYLNGFSSFVFAERVWTVGETFQFYKIVTETSFYKRLGQKGNIAARLKFGVSSNNVGPFAPFVLDSYVNIRGVGNRVDRGTGVVVLNLEHRQTVWQPSWGAVQLVAFTDLGAWRQDRGTFGDFVDTDNWQTFGGVGARLVLNQVYNMILRADYGLDFKGSRDGVVLGIGQYF